MIYVFEYLCEWNPKLKREAKTSEIHAKAIYLVDTSKDSVVLEDNIKVCSNCLRKKYFKHCKKKKNN